MTRVTCHVARGSVTRVNVSVRIDEPVVTGGSGQSHFGGVQKSEHGARSQQKCGICSHLQPLFDLFLDLW